MGAGKEVSQLLFGVGVLDGEHRHAMGDLCEAAERAISKPFGWAIFLEQGRVLRFEAL